MNDLRTQKKLLNERSNNLEKTNKSIIKENDELRDKIRKLKEEKIQRPNITDKDLSKLPKILQDTRKRDDKARTYAPKSNDKISTKD